MSTETSQAAVAAVQKEVESIQTKIIAMGDKVWTLSELSLVEEQSSAYLMDNLSEIGYANEGGLNWGRPCASTYGQVLNEQTTGEVFYRMQLFPRLRI